MRTKQMLKHSELSPLNFILTVTITFNVKGIGGSPGELSEELVT